MGRSLVRQGSELRDRLGTAAAHRALTRLREGRLVVDEHYCGLSRTYGPAEADLVGRIEILSPRACALLGRGSAGLGEGYIDSLWDTDDLLAVLRIGARELDRFDRLRIGLHWPRSLLHRLRKLVPRNTHGGARRNISAHYDLGNDLFRSFLDERMQYSCGIYEPEGARALPPDSDGLEEAQLRKLDRICNRLELSRNDHLLEIGTGWGGMAIHAAAEYGCRVTTTTISREQRAYATDLVEKAGLTDRVTVLGLDYRDLEGQFDRLVSVEMIEAVGWQYFSVFFDRCSRLLRPGGRMLLQAITLPDRLYEAEKATRTFANTHVFPGGCLPSEGVIERSANAAGLRSLDLRRIGSSYGPTLAAWRGRFLANWDDYLAKRYDGRFKRLWEFYLTYCEAGFRERRIDDVQILFEKALDRAPVVSAASYMAMVAST